VETQGPLLAHGGPISFGDLFSIRIKEPYKIPQSHDIQTCEILGDRSDSHLQPDVFQK